MTLSLLAILCGVALLAWSAERFIAGSAFTARYLGLPPLVIGMIVVGFGTSVPELAISARAAYQGNPEIALGNAYGSNIANIALILGLTALLRPITVRSRVLRRELPILMGVTMLAAYQVLDQRLTPVDALVLLTAFACLLAWTFWEGLRTRADSSGRDAARELDQPGMSLRRALFWLIAGPIVLVVSSRLLIWGAVEMARLLAVSDLIVGLTVVALGTSLPELASAVAATRRGEHDIAVGNVIGSNLFNTLAVVGIAAAIHPTAIPPEVFSREMVVMGGLTLLLFVLCYGFRGPGQVNRVEGGVLLVVFAGYIAYLAGDALESAPV